MPEGRKIPEMLGMDPSISFVGNEENKTILFQDLYINLG